MFEQLQVLIGGQSMQISDGGSHKLVAACNFFRPRAMPSCFAKMKTPEICVKETLD